MIIRLVLVSFSLLYSFSSMALLYGEDQKLLNCVISICHVASSPVYRVDSSRARLGDALRTCSENQGNKSFWFEDSTQAYSPEEAVDSFSKEYQKHATSPQESYDLLLKTPLFCYPVDEINAQSQAVITQPNVDSEEIVNLGNNVLMVVRPVLILKEDRVPFSTMEDNGHGLCRYLGYERSSGIKWDQSGTPLTVHVNNDGTINKIADTTKYGVESVNCIIKSN